MQMIVFLSMRKSWKRPRQQKQLVDPITLPQLEVYHGSLHLLDISLKVELRIVTNQTSSAFILLTMIAGRAFCWLLDAIRIRDTLRNKDGYRVKRGRKVQWSLALKRELTRLMIDNLPARQRQTFILPFNQELSYSESLLCQLMFLPNLVFKDCVK